MQYELRLATTASGVGYFGCYPVMEASFDESLAYLRQCPLDDFMHRYLLDMIGTVDEPSAGGILEMARGRDPVVVALIYEASLSFDHLAPLQSRFESEEIKSLLPYSSQIDIKWSLLPDRELHSAWVRLFSENVSSHRELPSLEQTGLPPLYDPEALRSAASPGAHIRDIYEKLSKSALRSPSAPLPAKEAARLALERLQAIDVIAEEEKRHASSLSPFAFFRRWRVKSSTKSGRHDFTFSGIQTSWGKGLTEDAARASYAMEMVERCSSFASIGPEGILDTLEAHPLVHGSFGELEAAGRAALDPNRLSLEVPYADEPLYWIEAMQQGRSGPEPVLVPVQCVYLFSNLDEISLFSGLGSTGLASGTIREQAKVSGLLEVIERDCEGTTPFDPKRCFRLEAEDPAVRELLASYEAKGARVQFQDLSREHGVPCYKCFVIDGQGQIVKGTGAHLDAKRALLSALTETTYPFPEGPPSSPGLEGLPAVRFEDLPNYSTKDYALDLNILETVLASNGYTPIYVDLTRKDLGFPVVKAIVPGMEWMADFDRFSRVSPRMFASFMKLR